MLLRVCVMVDLLPNRSTPERDLGYLLCTCCVQRERGLGCGLLLLDHAVIPNSHVPWNQTEGLGYVRPLLSSRPPSQSSDAGRGVVIWQIKQVMCRKPRSRLVAK